MVSTAYEQGPAVVRGRHESTVRPLVRSPQTLLDRYGLLDEPPRPDLEAIAALAAQVCGTPLSTIGVFTDTEHHHVAAYGIDPLVCRREDAMCHPFLGAASPAVVGDCLDEPRLRDNPFVNGEQAAIRFFASAHLTTPEGEVVGTLCVYDEVPRRLEPGQVAALRTLAERVVDVLELSVRSRELAASNERLAALAGQVSHDLKTPLAGITLALGLLREGLGAEDQDHLAALADRALRATGRMTSMVEEVLDHAVTDRRESRGPVALDGVVDEVVDDLASSLAGVRVARSPLPTVEGSRTGLRTLLQNLLDNAAKHRHPDRDLVVAVEAVRRPGAWRICVTDNGLGIPVGDRHRVFEPRTRLHTDVPGSGIGLDTCRRVAADHHGRMGISDGSAGPEGEPVGVSVWVELPDRPDVPRLWPVPST